MACCCGGAVCGQCPDFRLYAIDILSPVAVSLPSPCSFGAGTIIDTTNHSPCIVGNFNKYRASVERTNAQQIFGPFSFASGGALRNYAFAGYSAIDSATCGCELLIYCTNLLSQETPPRLEWYAITQFTLAHVMNSGVGGGVVVQRTSRNKLSSACKSEPYRSCESSGNVISRQQEFLAPQSDITITSSSDGFGAWQHETASPFSNACTANLLDTFSATFRIVKRYPGNPLP